MIVEMNSMDGREPYRTVAGYAAAAAAAAAGLYVFFVPLSGNGGGGGGEAAQYLRSEVLSCRTGADVGLPLATICLEAGPKSSCAAPNRCSSSY